MKHRKVARRYAMALMAVAGELGDVDRIGGDIDIVARTVRDSRELQLLLLNPIVPPGKKKAIVRELFSPRTGKETIALINLLITRHREGILAETTEQFAALRDEKEGIVNVAVTTAGPLTPEQEKNLKTRLEEYTRRNVRVRVSQDRSIMGGLLMQIGDTVLDASVRHQLELLRRRMLVAVDAPRTPERTAPMLASRLERTARLPHGVDEDALEDDLAVA